MAAQVKTQTGGNPVGPCLSRDKVGHRVRSYELSEFPIEPWQQNWRLAVATPVGMAALMLASG